MYLVAAENYEESHRHGRGIIVSHHKTILENNKDKSMNIWIGLADSTRKDRTDVSGTLGSKILSQKLKIPKCRTLPYSHK